MSQSNLVFRIQFKVFLQEKGMLAFYGLVVAIIGIMIPVFLGGIEVCFTMASLFTALFLKPILSDSMAGEREHRTLETLLSAPIEGKSIIWGKVKFCLLFSVVFFCVTVVCGVLTSWFMGYEINLTVIHWICIIILAVFNYGAISIAGVHASAISNDMQAANSRVSRIAYIFGLMFTIYLTGMSSVDLLISVIMVSMLVFIYLCVIVLFFVKINKMKQSNYFERLKIKKAKTYEYNSSNYHTPKAQFQIVLGFEIKYLWTLKMLLLNFAGLCFAPLLFAGAMAFYFGGKFNIDYAVFITAFMIPRVPINLIAYSIGGEKSYKTGESLLSTPLHIRPVFLAKCMVPIIITVTMLIASSLITLGGIRIIASIAPSMILSHGYTVAQLVLLFPVSILSSVVMMFLSAILAVVLKTPRHSLYVTSIGSILFLLPVMVIVYLASSSILIWSIVYSIILFICTLLCMKTISDKISRPQIMSRL